MLKDVTINNEPIKIKRALISVYDKTNVEKLAESLIKNDIQIISTGGTAEVLIKNEIPITKINDFTGFPEIFDGRVKTLNPSIAGGILGLRDVHDNEITANRIEMIDLVVCNLYPFVETISKDGCTLSTALENIDIGGPTMIRSAAKNVGWTCVVVEPSDYTLLIEQIDNGGNISYNFRSAMSRKAFSMTAQYESSIDKYLTNDELPDKLNLSFTKFQDLRYGENPQQKSSVYLDNSSHFGILNSQIHQGKKLSYNNIMDADAAVSCITEFSKPGCVVIKHANPCGAAIGNNIDEAFVRAIESDKLSAFGGIVALNKECTAGIANYLKDFFIEIIIAPSFSTEALDIFSTKKNLRVIDLNDIDDFKSSTNLRHIHGGLLVQEEDGVLLKIDSLETVTKTLTTDSINETLSFGWSVLKYIKSNAILIAKDCSTVSIGAGQVSRVDSVNIALSKLPENIDNAILFSDAFFPFRDSIDQIAKAGIKTVVQPGGSVRDAEVINACNEHDITMMFTGYRCFKH
tara:strand:- start:6969 stop:8522 length:1554 start_codon:yes stop_codon:yes gene_type:complete